MGKLQKRFPPTSPGGPAHASIEGGTRYENLPQATQQPVPISASTDQATISGAVANPSLRSSYLAQTPFSPYEHTARRAGFAHVDSPISPMMGLQPASQATLPPAQLHAPQPQRQAADARKSVELRRLDGKPYPTTEQGKKVNLKVAKDMHEGALPPAYKRQASDPVDPTSVAQALSTVPPLESAGTGAPAGHGCNKCGKRRTTSNGQPQTGHSCNSCGKRKTNAPAYPPSSFPGAAHVRSVSESSTIAARPMPSTQTIAGPSSPPSQPRCCNKCGKHKKPMTAPLPQDQFARQQPRAPLSAPMVSQPFSRVQQAGLSIQPTSNAPQIDVVPPTASTSRPITSAFSNYADDSPLVAKSPKSEFKLFRNSSIVRSLSRHRSKKDKHISGPLPSQQLSNAQHTSGEQSAGRLINMINNAIGGGDKQSNSDKRQAETQYSKLDVEEPVDRPTSPFSFMETPKEDEAFEMVDFEKDDKEKKNTGEVPVIVQERLDVEQRPKSMEAAVPTASAGLLNVPREKGDRSRPPITRFKSLRSGVSRATSLSRGSSLRRLESLKGVHRNWYRDDMAIEGASGESVPVF